MKKQLLLLIAITGCLITAKAQTTEAEATLKDKSTIVAEDSPWNKKGDFSINFSQLALNNWTAGGLNSISFNSFFNYYLNYAKGNITWDNSINLGFGLIKQGDKSSVWLKSDDKIDISSKFGMKASERLYYAGLVGFTSQFVEGYETSAKESIISNFLAPGYVLAALGIDYKPSDKLSVFVAPVTYKGTIVMDEDLSSRGAFGVEMNANFRSEMGGYMKVQYITELMKNVSYTGKLGLFSNYFDSPQYIDVSWENTFAMKVNEYLSANLMTHLIYDEDIDIDSNNDGAFTAADSKIQFKQLFGAGLIYKF